MNRVVNARISSDARTKVVYQRACDYHVYDARQSEAEGEEPAKLVDEIREMLQS